MIDNTNKQAGSAHILIIVVLVIALMGALGYIFWQKYTASQAVTQHSTQAAQPTTDNAVEQYATLADWNVKFKIDDSLKATSIVSHKQQDATGREYYVINTARNDAWLHKACPSVTDPVGLQVYQFTDKPAADESGQLLESDGKLLNSVAIDGHYYALVKMAWACPEGIQNVDSTSDDSASDGDGVEASLRTLQSTK